MSLVLSETLILAKTRSQDLKSVLRLNCWGSGIKDVSLVRELVNVEVIGLSCNEVTTLRDFAHCKKLKELILKKNKIKDISEISHLTGLPKLTNLWLEENPCVETTHNYRKVVIRALPQLTVLDNKPITQDELNEIEELGDEIYEEIPYESSNSAGSSGPASNTASSGHRSDEIIQQDVQTDLPNSTHCSTQQYPGESSILNTANNTPQMSMNESMLNKSIRYQALQKSVLSPRGSMNALNTSIQPQSWLSQSNNNTINSSMNNMLPKGGKSRNGNILSAVLCLVKELDYTSCEVALTALHCRMEETSQ